MHLAIVNKTTKLVENIAVKPVGANVWFGPGEGYEAIETDVGAIGDTYENGEFIPANPPAPPEEPQDPAE